MRMFGSARVARWINSADSAPKDDVITRSLPNCVADQSTICCGSFVAKIVLSESRSSCPVGGADTECTDVAIECSTSFELDAASTVISENSHCLPQGLMPRSDRVEKLPRNF